MNDIRESTHGTVYEMHRWTMPPSSIRVLSDEENKKRLNETKSKIDPLREHGYTPLFTQIAHMLHPFELVRDVSNRTINRAHAKMAEMGTKFDLYPRVGRRDKNPAVAACLCEAPGAFVEAILKYGGAFKVLCISLIEDVKDTNKEKDVIQIDQRIENEERCEIFRGGDGTGDITHQENIGAFQDRIAEMSGSEMADLVTADGGFEVSDFNEQEDESSLLFYSEALMAVSVLKRGGDFVIKLFDMFNPDTQRLMYILTQCFDTSILYKPLTSRVCNSERYAIFKGFAGIDDDSLAALTYYVVGDRSHVREIQMSDPFVRNMQHYNTMMVDYQINRLEIAVRQTLETIELMKNISLRMIVENQYGRVPKPNERTDNKKNVTYLSQEEFNNHLQTLESMDDEDRELMMLRQGTVVKLLSKRFYSDDEALNRALAICLSFKMPIQVRYNKRRAEILADSKKRVAPVVSRVNRSEGIERINI